MKMSRACFALIVTCIFCTIVCSQNRGLIRYEESRVSMACTYTIIVYARDGESASRSMSAAFAEIDRIDRLMSHYKPESPLSRLNREAVSGPVKVDPELFDFIAECLEYSRASDGAFDITVGPLMKTWGFFRGEGRLPNSREIAAALRRIGYRHLILNERDKTIQFDRPGIELDLGGVAKGYAVDRAIAILVENGIESAMISAGGSTIYGLGSPPDSSGWEVNLQDPSNINKIVATVSLKNEALSVSGSYEKFFEVKGRRYSHIMDPRTGWPIQNVVSVAVVAKTGMAGDALDNLFYVKGSDWTRRQGKKFPAWRIFFFLAHGAKGSRIVEIANQNK